jgi:hypothetical protein
MSSSSSSTSPSSVPNPKGLLVQLCGHHITAATSVKHTTVNDIKLMFESWLQQIVRPKFYVSFSYETQELRTQVRELINNIMNTNTHGDLKDILIILDHSVKPANNKSQFQHISTLMDRIKSDHADLYPNTVELWCLFTDADDVSHRGRTKAYTDMLHKLHDQGKLTVTNYICEEDATNTATMLGVRIPGDPYAGSMDHEYHHYCMRLITLYDFFDRCHPSIIAHPFADTMLVHYFIRPDLSGPGTSPFIRYNVSIAPSIPMIQPARIEIKKKKHINPLITQIDEAYNKYFKIKYGVQVKSSFIDMLIAQTNYVRLTLLHWLMVSAVIYIPCEQDCDSKFNGLMCPTWEKFLKESRYVQEQRHAMIEPTEHHVLCHKVLDEWQKEYERYVRTDKEFRAWIDAPRSRFNLPPQP